MKECKCCRVSINEHAEFCPVCGYDPRTDAIHPSFRQNPEPLKAGVGIAQVKRRLSNESIRPGVKIFALISLAVVIFGVVSQNKQSLNVLISEFKKPGYKAGVNINNIIPLEPGKKIASGGETGERKVFNPAKPLILEGITWGGIMPEAMINNQVYHVGNVIEGATIIKISKEGVVVLYEGFSYLLPSFASKYRKD